MWHHWDFYKSFICSTLCHVSPYSLLRRLNGVRNPIYHAVPSALTFLKMTVFLNHNVITHYWCNYVCGKCLDVVATSGQQMKKHFLKCHDITDVHEKPDSQGSASDGGQLAGKPSKSHHSNDSGSKAKRTRMTDVATKIRVIMCMAQRSPKLMVKQLFRMIFRRVCIKVFALPVLVQQVEVKKMWAKHRASIRVTRSWRSTARAHIRSCVIDARHSMFNFFPFHNVILIIYTVHHLLVVCHVCCIFSPPHNQHGWVVYCMSICIKWSN